jgi:ATP-dependent Zn protease
MAGLALDRAATDYYARVAAMTPGMSGAQIANVCNEAALYAAREGKKSISIGDFDHAVDRVLAGAEKKSKTLSAEERRIVAYHESGHVLTAWFLEHADPLLKTTIVPRTSGVRTLCVCVGDGDGGG